MKIFDRATARLRSRDKYHGPIELSTRVPADFFSIERVSRPRGHGHGLSVAISQRPHEAERQAHRRRRSAGIGHKAAANMPDVSELNHRAMPTLYLAPLQGRRLIGERSLACLALASAVWNMIGGARAFISRPSRADWRIACRMPLADAEH